MTSKKNIAIIIRTLNFKSETFLLNIIEIVSKECATIIYFERGSKEDKNRLKNVKGVQRTIELTPLNAVLSILGKPLRAVKFWSQLNGTKKRKFLDLAILLNERIEVLYFPFGYNTTHREQYGQVMNVGMAVSFMGSDLFVWPKTHNHDYTPLLKACRQIHCNSSALKKAALDIQPTVSNKIRIIPSGLRREFENIDLEDIQSIRKELYAQSAEVITTVGRLNWIKGYEPILFALADLRSKGYPFVYNIIGYGSEEEKLKLIAQKLGLEDSVVFHGYKNTTEIIDILKSSTLYVQTSWSEGFSNSVLEAQAMGLYSVVTPVSGMNDIINFDYKGCVLEDFNQGTLNTKMESLMNIESFEWRNSNANKIRQATIQGFGFEVFKNNWLQFFKESVK